MLSRTIGWRIEKFSIPGWRCHTFQPEDSLPTGGGSSNFIIQISRYINNAHNVHKYSYTGATIHCLPDIFKGDFTTRSTPGYIK